MITVEQVISCTHDQLQEWLDTDQLSADQTFKYILENLPILHIFANNKKTKDIRKKIEIIVNKTKEVDSLDSRKMTPLERAILNGNTEAAKAFIFRKANVNHVIPDSFDKHLANKTPILLLLAHRRAFLKDDLAEEKEQYIDLIKRLISYEPDLDARDYFGVSALHLACENGDVEVIELIRDKMKHSLDLLDKSRMTPLHYAAKEGYEHIVELLLGKCGLILMPFFNTKNPPETLPTKYNHVYIITKDKNEIYYIQKTSEPKIFKKIPLIDEKEGLNGYAELFTALKLNRWEVFVELFALFNPNTLENSDIKLFRVLSLEDEEAITRITGHNIKKKRADPNVLSGNNNAALHLMLESPLDPNIQCKLIRALVDSGAYPNQMNEYGDTPLHLAAKTGNYDVVSLMINELKKLNIKHSVKNDAGITPFYCAIMRDGDLETIKILSTLEGADEPSNKGIMPIHEAAGLGRLDLVKYFIEERNFDVTKKDVRGYSIFHAAAGCGQLAVVVYLLEKNVPMTSDNLGRTPIFHAVESGNIELVKAIMNHPFYLNILDNQARNLLFTAVESWCVCKSNELSKYQEIFEFVRERSQFDLNIADKNGFNLIYVSIIARKKLQGIGEFEEKFYPGNREHVINYLIKKGVKPWISNKKGGTPFSVASYIFLCSPALKSEARDEYRAICHILSQHIPNNIKPIYYRSQYYSTLHLLNNGLKKDSEENILAILNELLNIGADPNVILNSDGETAIFFAVRNQSVNILRSLYLKGAKLNVVNKFGRPPSFRAGLYRFSDVIMVIDEFLIGLFEEYPLHAATQSGNINTIKKLITYGADPNSEDKSHKRPIDYAREGGLALVSDLLTIFKVIDSVSLNLQQLKKHVASEKSPVIWTADLDITYHSEKFNKNVTVPASDVHKELRAFENLFRRRIENDKDCRKQSAQASDEQRHNRPQGFPIEYDNQPNFAVASITFVVSDSIRAEPHGTHGRCITSTIPIKIISPDRKTQKNIYHVRDFFDARDNEKVGREKFIASLKEYAESARDFYKMFFKTDIILDKKSDYNDNRTIFHSEQALHEFLEQKISLIIKEQLLGMVLSNENKVMAGYKVYALVLDIYSTREMCGNCVDRTIGMQRNISSNKFMHNLHKVLEECDLLFPKAGVRMITRVSSDLQSKGDPHVHSPDDQPSKTKVLISEKNEAEYPCYMPLYNKIRGINIKELENSVVLASPQKYASSKFSKKYIEPTKEGKYTIFTTQAVKETADEEKIYALVFKPSVNGS